MIPTICTDMIEKQITSCDCGLTQLAFKLDFTLLLNILDKRNVFVNKADRQMVKLRLTPNLKIEHEK